jgi:hypothetical protein
MVDRAASGTDEQTGRRSRGLRKGRTVLFSFDRCVSSLFPATLPPMDHSDFSHIVDIAEAHSKRQNSVLMPVFTAFLSFFPPPPSMNDLLDEALFLQLSANLPA